MLQKLFILITWIACIACFPGCNDDKLEMNGTFEIDTEGVDYDEATNTLSLKGQRQTVSLTVTTDDATGRWDARCPTDDLWCSYRKDKNKLIITVADNTTDEVRSSYIEVILGDQKEVINIEQDYSRRLYFASDMLRVGSSRGTYSIGITTNILGENLAFKVLDGTGMQVGDEFWLNCNDFEDGLLSFQVSKNFSATDDRTATIVAYGDEVEAEFTLTQNMTFGVPYTIDLTGLDYAFPDSYIYEIWCGEQKVGNICREYLYKVAADGSSSVQQVAVVAYPMVQGKIEHSNGLLIATLDEVKNADRTTTVTPLSNGGSVMWNGTIGPATAGNEMLVSCTAGEQTALPAKMYLSTGATGFNLTGLDEDDAPLAQNAAIRPWTVTDERLNGDQFVYRIVKVGPQYWMADNLRTTFFPDGSVIPTNDWTAARIISEPRCASAGYANNSATGYSSANALGTSAAALEVRQTTGPVYNFLCLFGKNAAMPDVTKAYAGPKSDGLAPAGWAVPKVNEFKILYNYISQSAKPGEVYPCNELVLNGVKEPNATNITGFGAQGFRYRAGEGKTNDSNGTPYATIDGYDFTGTAGSGSASDHKTTVFCCGVNTTVSFRVVDAEWGAYVRCIQRN